MSCETCDGRKSYRRVCGDGVSSIETCDICYEKTFVGGLFLQNERLRSDVEKLRKYRRNARRAYRELQTAYERLCLRASHFISLAQQLLKEKFSNKRESAMITLGREYRDKVSGFAGIATGHTHYLSGCSQVLLIPKATEEGKILSTWFDEQRLEEMGGATIVLENETTPGGDIEAPIH